MGIRRNVFAEPEPPPFDIETERDRRRQAVLSADRALSIAVEALKVFQSDHYAVDGHGRMVPKVTIDAVPNVVVDLEHQRLVRAISEAHNEFQKSLKLWNQL